MFSEDVICQLLQKNYNLAVSQIKYIDHSENVLYKITSTSGDVFALKIHIFSQLADFDAFAPDIHSTQQLENMMNFLLFLSQYKNEFIFKTPRPIYNKEGRFISLHQGIPFSIVTWCPGEDIAEKKCNMTLFTELGKALANFHCKCKTYFPTCILSRPSYDISYLNRLEKKFREKIRLLSLKNEITQNIYMGFDLLRKQIQSLEVAGLEDMIVHGDMSPSNVIYDGTALYLIDFNFVGIGSIYQDLASMSFEISDKQIQTSIFSGYESIAKTLNRDYIKFYEILRTILYIVANISNIKDFSWISHDPLEWVDRLRQGI